MGKLLKKMRSKDWILALASIIFIFIQVWFDLSLPEYMSRITLLVQNGSEINAILRAGGFMLLFALGSLAASCITAVCVSGLAFSYGGNLRKALFHQVMSFSMEESEEFSTASLITRSTNDITQVQSMIVMGLQIIVKAPITAIGAIGKISASVWQWTTATVIGAVIIVAVVVGCILMVIPKQKKVQILTDNINRVTRENLVGISVIHAYNAEDYVEEKFSKVNDDLTKTNLFVVQAMAFLSPTVQLIMNGMSLSIYWIGAILISQAGVTEQAGLFASMLAFAQYAVQVVNAFVMLTMIFTMIPRALVSARRINEVLDTKPAITGGRFDGCGELHGTVEFRHVDFCYPGEDKPTIKNITFHAEKGQTVAIIGATGSGKSSVINLIPRFYDVSSGEILIDGVNVKEYTLEALRNKLGYCPQQTQLLSGSVRFNVGYGFAQQGDEAISEAICTAQAEEFVQNMDGGYDADVAQGGTNLSGGQKQRLSIARALAKEPEILIFDDSFSALDYKTEKMLREDLKKNYDGITKLIVTQRIGTVRDANLILVMDKGKIVGQGTHQQLLESCEIYRQIAASQNGTEAIA